jgi:hypothetical protein
VTARPGFSYVFAGLAVVDYEAATGWYERLFGRPPDTEPMTKEALWHLTGTSSVYVVEDRLRAGTNQLAVGDLDAQLEDPAFEAHAGER